MAGELLSEADLDLMAETVTGSFWDTFTTVTPATAVDAEGNVAGATTESDEIAGRFAVRGMDGVADELLVADQAGQQVDAVLTFARGLAIKPGQVVLVSGRGRFLVHQVLDSRSQARALLQRVDG